MKRLALTAAALLLFALPSLAQNELNTEMTEADGFFYQGQIFAHKKEYKLAYNAYLNALAEDPKHERARISLAILLGLQKEYAKGLKEIDRVLKLYPRSFQAHKVKAKLLQDSKQYAAAAESYTQYLKLIPQNLLKDREEIEKEIAMLQAKGSE